MISVVYFRFCTLPCKVRFKVCSDTCNSMYIYVELCNLPVHVNQTLDRSQLDHQDQLDKKFEITFQKQIDSNEYILHLFLHEKKSSNSGYLQG